MYVMIESSGCYAESVSECIYVDSMGGATGLVENILCRDLPDSKSDP